MSGLTFSSVWRSGSAAHRLLRQQTDGLSTRRVAAWGVTFALVLALLGCGFARWPLSVTKIGDSLNASLGASPRLLWSAPQAAAFVALPWPSVHIVDAQLNDDYGVNLLNAPRARLDLSLLELLRGRLVPAGATLVNPTVTLDLDRPPFAGQPLGLPEQARVAGALTPLASLRLSNGVLRLVSKSRGLDTLIDGVRGRLDGLTIGHQLRFDLSAVWRNVPIAIVGTLIDPEAGAKGAPSPLALALDSPVARLAFNGTLVGGASPELEGDATMSIASIAALAKLIGAPIVWMWPNDLSIKGKAKATPEAISLNDLALTSARQTFEGALQIADVGGRPNVSGTFAAEEAAVAPFLGPADRFVDPAGGWKASPFAVGALQAFDLDLRLSAARLDIYGHALSKAAASVIVRSGRLSASLIEAGAFDGHLRGDADVECVGKNLKIDARGELVDADLGAAFADFGRPVATGRGGARFDVATFGDSPAAAIAGLSGSASLDAVDGGIVGVNLEEALRRSQRHLVDIGRDTRLGGTSFDKLAVSVVLDKGRAAIDRGEMASRGISVGAKGVIDLAARGWDVKLRAVQTDSSGAESENAARLAFDVKGPWSAPTIRATGAGAQAGSE
jgi:AsmA protein